ncbi:metallophosphoesterase family protein [Paenibacillus hamazuiensis]|uniref:metallophosphoesterase family protein n=1 Tax=Paenibacillus hamazuiensis TaxID=2936508 RepID=UPI00200D9F82|nr:metallophosphoesterase [Paenibacillus hamazuiensis]
MKFFVDKERFGTDKRPWHGNLHGDTEGALRFAVLGDRTGFALPGVFEQALDKVKRMKPDFILSVGDLIEGYRTSAQEAHEEWDEIDGMTREIGVPFFKAIGNHDCGSALMLNVWRERYGAEYYAFRRGNALFLILNTEDPPVPLHEKYIPVLREMERLVRQDPASGEAALQSFFARLDQSPDEEHESGGASPRLGEEQLVFAANVLAENRDAAWTFVIMHRPLWKTSDPGYARLEQLLEDRKHTVFAGHLHDLEMTEGRSGGMLIQLGRTGACKHRAHLRDGHHILWITIENGMPRCEVVRLDGC